MPLSTPNPDPWALPRRVFRSDGTVFYQSPEAEFGGFNGRGDWGRAQALAAEVRRMDFQSGWVDAELKRLQALFRAGHDEANATFWRDMPIFEQKLESAVRASLGGSPEQRKQAENDGSRMTNASVHGASLVPPPATPAAPGPVASPEIKERIWEIVSQLHYIGVQFRLDPVDGSISYSPVWQGQVSPEERALLLDYYYDFRQILKDHPGLCTPGLVGGRPMLPNYPRPEPVPSRPARLSSSKSKELS